MHLCVYVKNGQSVSLTSTVNGLFGSKIVTEHGLVLNDQLDDFGLRDSLNGAGPNKRPLSSAVPLFLMKDNEVILIAGGTGGIRISTGVAQAVFNIIQRGMDVQEAVRYPRIHHDLVPNVLSYESNLDKTIVDYLESCGHEMLKDAPQRTQSAIEMIVVNDGKPKCGVDPRKGGCGIVTGGVVKNRIWVEHNGWVNMGRLVPTSL